MITISALFPGGGINFTCVGKVAPPRPTIPEAAILSTISLEDSAHSFTKVSLRSIVSSHSSPSTSIYIAGRLYPLASRALSILFTLPDTEEWMFADTKPPALASNVPTFTRSPFFTTACAGAPICWLRGIITCLGVARAVIFLPADSLFSGGCIPPIRNVLSILLDFNLDLFFLHL